MNPFVLGRNMESLFDGISSKTAPAQGRRAVRREPSKPPVNEDSTVVAEDATSQVKPEEDVGIPKMTKPGRRRQMWSAGGEEVVQDSRLVVKEDSDEEEIPTIPDLEQINEGPMIEEISAPPVAVLNELLSYQELDSNLKQQSAFRMLDNEIDLKVLTKELISEKDTFERDETWEMDRLFQDMRMTISSSRKNTIGQDALDKPEREALI